MSRRSIPSSKTSACSAAPPAAAFNLPFAVGCALVFAATLVAYAPTLSGNFIWDDDGHVTRAGLRSLAGLTRIWFEPGATQQYYPLLHSAFWIEHRLWGNTPFGYHLLNVLLHSLNACLFATLLRRLAVPGAWFAAALFALHPVCVESVAWIAEQKNTLSALFYLSAALAYLRFDAARRPRTYAFAIVLFIGALLTKTVTATLPAGLLVIFWWRHGSLSWRRDVVPLLPWFVFGAGSGLLTAHFERVLIGASGADFDFSFAQRLLIAGRVIWFYLGKLLWPENLIFIYPRWTIDATSPAQWLFPIAAVALLAALYSLAELRKSSRAVATIRWPSAAFPATVASRVSEPAFLTSPPLAFTLAPTTRRARAPLAVLLLFAGTLFPVLGFFNVYPFIFSFVADHFQYLACLAVIALAAAALARFFAQFPRWISVASAAALLLALGALTWSQASMYRDDFALYTTTLARNPDAWMAHNNLAMAFTEAGRTAEAIPHLEAALELHPRYAIAESNLGDDLTRLGRAAEAIPHLERALTLQPDYAEAHNNLGVALAALDRKPEAIEHYERSLQINPDNASAHRNLALALATSDRPAEALPHFARAAQLDPHLTDAQLGWAIALMLTGRFADSIPHFERACELDPSPKSHSTYGRALAAHGQPDAAVAQFRAALALDPNSGEAHFNLAVALRSLGRADEAQSHFLAARQLGASSP